MAEEQKDDLNIGENERVGDYLYRIRKMRGLDLDHLAKSIRLGKNILEAIEANNWSFFPTEAYLRSYIVSLCDKLSLDKTIVLKKFSAEINSQFWITQTNIMNDSEKEKESPEASSGNVPKAAIIIVVVIIAILFFASRLLSSYSKEDEVDEFDMEEFQKTEEPSDSEQNTSDSASVNSLNTTDSVPQAQVVQVAEVVSVVPGSDSLRFECTPSSTDSTCGVTIKEVDKKMSYFKKMTTRSINREDTVQVVITVPLRTKLFVNNARVDYGNFNTLLFYNGKIVGKVNRELR